MSEESDLSWILQSLISQRIAYAAIFEGDYQAESAFFQCAGMTSNECSRWKNLILSMWSVILRKFQLKDLEIPYRAMSPLFYK